jgi:hypothetical protein
MVRSFIPRTGPRRRNAALASAGAAAIITGGVLTLVGTASAASPPATRASHLCRNATLKGTYIYYNDGWVVSRGKRKPFSIAGVDHFSGADTGHGVTTFVVNGKLVNDNTHETSIYTIKADCIGKIVFDTAGSIGHFNVYVSPSGRLLSLIETDRGSVGGGTESRVAR